MPIIEPIVIKALRRLLIVIMLYSGVSMADSRFWLPVSYQHHYQALLNASKVAAADPDCEELIEGVLVEHQSTVDYPSFKFYCRTQKKKIFVMVVDGLSMQVTMNDMAEIRRKREIEKQRELERIQQEQEDKARREKEAEILKKKTEEGQYWKICHRAFKHKSRYFEKLSIISPLPPKPAISSEGIFTYSILFDAESMGGQALHYKARAVIDSLDLCDVTIKPRK